MDTNTNQSPRAERVTTYKKLAKWMWRLAILGLLAVVGLFVYLSFFENLPSFEELENPKTNLATEVIADDGSTIGRFYIENRVPVKFEQLSPHLVNALVATEDARYYNHAGIDVEALGRVVYRTLLGGDRSGGGGSTVTQQLAKLLYTKKPSSSLKRAYQKLKEWVTAVRLEKSYTKEEIMAMYFNQFDFLYSGNGIKAASEIYFNKSQDSLSLEEAAMLVGMLKNPALFNPVRRPDTTHHRRMIVLNQMVKAEMLDRATYDSLRVLPLGLKFNRSTHSEGLAPYFREELRKEVKKILADLTKKDGVERNVHTGGYKIYTTINAKMQAHAEAAVAKHMPQLQEKFWRSWRGKDPWTYKATDEEKEIRKNAFERVVRESGRYQKIRETYLTTIIKAVNEKHSIVLKDFDIIRLMKAEEDDNYIGSLRQKKLISKQKGVTYRKILRNDELFRKLKNRWNTFQKAVTVNFKKKVKMKVFDYASANMEKDTVMAPYDSIRYHRMFLQTGSIAVHPRTGHVKAWVGGINHKYFKFDHVNMNTLRQVGSTFKPFVYATAVNMQGISPCFTVLDEPVTIHRGEGEFGLLQDWTPRNANEKYTGQTLTLQEGLRQSKNTVSAFLMKQLRSTQPVRELVSNLGINVNEETYPGELRVPKQPSICLGAVNLSVFEMGGAFGAFANNGIYNTPIFIERIEDKNGNIIHKSYQEERQALPEEANYIMVDMMRKVVEGANGKYGVKSQIAGKTGTTNKQSDGWYMGMTPEIVVATWVGGDDRWIRFTKLSQGQGSRMAGPIFYNFLKNIEKDKELDFNTRARFKVPARELSVEIDCSKYNIPPPPSNNGGIDEGGGDFFEDEIDDQPSPQANNNTGTSTNTPTTPSETASDGDEDFGDDFN